MSNNTPGTATVLTLSAANQPLDEFVGSTDPIDYFQLNVGNNDSAKVEVSGGLYNLELYHDANGDRNLTANEKLLSVTGQGSSVSTGNLSLGSSSSTINGQVSRNTTIQGSMTGDDYFLKVFSDNLNSHYTLSLDAAATPPPIPTPPQNQTIIGTAGGDNLLGGNGDDIIQGLAGNDNITAGSGNDIINGGVGNDNIIGGSGIDTAIFSGAYSSYQINVAGNSTTGTITGPDGFDLITGVEKLQFSDRTIDLAGSSPTPPEPEPEPQPNEIVGTAGKDNLSGTDASDQIQGLGGKDKLRGFDGDDVLLGGNGKDKLWGGNGNDTLQGDAGNDFLDGEAGNDRLSGGAGNDRLWGGSGNDELTGGSGNDLLKGGSGDDQLLGGNGRDRLFGGSGVDVIKGELGDDLLKAGSGNDQLFGGEGLDQLFGGGGSDTLYGGNGDDLLNGGGGSDILYGGAGNDQLYGKGGKDTFVLELDQGVDVIADFNLKKDLLGLGNGLNFSDLSIVQGIGANAADTEIYTQGTGDFLATISNIQATQIRADHFVNI